MYLRTQLINFFKHLDGGILGVELQGVLFQTSKGGYFSSESIIRATRLLAEEGRLKKRFDDKNLVVFRYNPSKYENLHAKLSQ